MKLRQSAIILVSTIPCIAMSHLYLDEGIAGFFAGMFRKDSLFSAYFSDLPNLPDLLLIFAVIGTIISWSAHTWFMRRRIDNAYERFFHLSGWTIPLSFLAKSILKSMCGKITTRAWLKNPDLYGFHWFHGGSDFSGFPSGHMAVFTVYALAAGRFFPRYRLACAGFMLLLAAALMVTSYHFLSDVLAGALVGFLVDACTYGILFSRKDTQSGSQAIQFPGDG
ncbi:MAG: phosphoesterase, PA-phosphatase related protein [Geobacteraceae bacterium]|nr:phosphoesterase, PA-phosphatase related protein [Geobacteraceae bacterium]